jgi:hypothetical protein
LLAVALLFPVYFGRNRDATYDRLIDLASGDSSAAVMIITNCAQFYAGIVADWLIGQRVFNDAAAY